MIEQVAHGHIDAQQISREVEGHGGPQGAYQILLLMYQPGFRKGTGVMLYHLWITEFIVSDTDGTGACALTLENTPGPTNCS